ncbi:hypothetical protein K2Y11_05690, partial [bacterium]|nr:hypothetical protein [bacterium]
MATGLVGCKHQQVVEAELRYQNRRVRELEQKLCQKNAEVQTLQTMAAGCETSPDGLKDTPDTIYRRESMSRVGLGLTTGPRDLDKNGCDDAVQYSIICYDYDGDTFKCPGSAELELVAIQESGVPITVGTWQIAPDRLRETWRSSVLGSGYQIVMPVPDLQQSKKWQAIVKFSTLDGRVFQASKDFELSKPKAGLKPPEPVILRDGTSGGDVAPPAELPAESSPLRELPKTQTAPTPEEGVENSLPLEPSAPAKDAVSPDVPTSPVIDGNPQPALPPAVPEPKPELPNVEPAPLLEPPAVNPIVPTPPRQTTYVPPTLSRSSRDSMV